ncbi:prolyl-tRNA synthetase associated domain-contain ing protein [Desulfonema ishimotonii]|uniref:Prolyl-tRNA synthetase associated domain-contain ing protein n=1 Tax=Desulfonema ishimotonii TaxID=45657 RepID=A0A401FWT1_9BACT|nr:prolyl-tRNA synthetase associated domain-containing protein [Desulfonema ishimotonii]GBC61411.1 prolyl-tRNA synthetase associated domain-contain ing protein [Desulfonema ishimotonii]
MTDIYEFLTQHNIPFERHDHPPVYTVEEADRLVPPLSAAKTKNLFLRDKKGKRHFLVVVPGDKQVDLKGLTKAIGTDKISFGSPERLKKHLGIEPGSVSMLAVANDAEQAVELFIDKALWADDAFQCHPLVNTATLVVPKTGIEAFFSATGHEAHLIEVPARN